MKRTGLIVICIFIITSIFAYAAVSRKTLVQRIRNAEYNLRYIMSSPDSSIPQQFLKDAYAIIFLKQYKGGFVVGVKGGNGIILAKNRETGEWSPPAFMATAEGSFGLQIGGKVIDAILLVMNEEGLTLLLKSPVKIGGEISAAAGPVGRDVGVGAGLPATGLFIYSRARGAFIGGSIEGGLIMCENEANKIFYGIEDITAREILLEGRVPMPKEAESLIKALKKYEGSSN
ncbi:MAG: lipid-binding SYLF domain-containing protein [Candidatus Omnitrophica bacterium]|nr:lipid-binding SYLF domain-containing protein [Candidatus Omnitrophota bacterium]